MPLDPLRVKAVFEAALHFNNPVEQAAFLDRECGADDALRRRLADLLAGLAGTPPGPVEPLPTHFAPVSATHEASALPSGPTVVIDGPQAISPEPSVHPFELESPIGTTIAGRYKVRQEIGEGGMGTVYLAEQIQPVKRQVALKLIRLGMDSKTVLARFDSERQALAIMDHPNIARVLDAGTTAAGRPFFVMELVRGVPLNDYCDRHRLGLPERLGLFRQICSAVQHAHQKGIIHRDLKPTNILVEGHDGHPVPKVIDFGLAKAIKSTQLTEQSLFTAFGTITGTPLYMAPEQATFNAVDVDTRTDIYALGVILYELLTGSTPIRRETFQRSALEEILRVVREEEPPTPSQRISSSDALPSLSANRRIEPSKLGRFVRGDLDWIVMKALAKERSRRYDSAIGLAHDIERFINHEPVTARPPTARYRLRKFAARNRSAVIAASLIVLALVGGVIGTSWGLVEARRQEREARRQELIAITEAVRKEQALQAEADQRRQAERRLSQIAKINAILGSIFGDLDPKRAEKTRKPLTALLGERLDQATAAIEGEAIGDPLAVARLQQTLGRSQRGLGYPVKAIELLTRARATFIAILGPDDLETLATMDDLANSEQDAGHFDRAIPLFEQTQARRLAQLGADDPKTLTTLNNLATALQAAGQLDRAIPLLEQTKDRRQTKLGPDHPDTLVSLVNLAMGYQASGQFDRALPLLEQTLELEKGKFGPDDPTTLDTANNLAGVYQAVGRVDRALPLLESTLAARKARFGPDHPETLNSMTNLAGGFQDSGQLDRAIPLFEQTLGVLVAKLGPEHPETLNTKSSLALALNEAGQLDRSLPLLEQTLEARKRTLGLDHPSTLVSMNNLALGHGAAGQPQRALALFEETLALRRAKSGPDHPATLRAMANVAATLGDLGQADRAIPMLEQILAARQAKLGVDHPDTLNGMNNLAAAYQSAGRFDKALPLLEQTLALEQVKLGRDHPETIIAMSNLAAGYQNTGKLDRAIPIYEEALKLSEAKLGSDHPRTLTIINILAGAYRTVGKFDQAIPLFERALAGRQTKLGADHPDTLKSMNNLALGYASAERFDEAISLLEQTLAARQAKLGPDHPDTLSTMSNLANADRSANKLDKAILLFEQTLERSRAKLGPEHPETLAALTNLASTTASAGQFDRAVAAYRELADIRKQLAGADSPVYASVLATLGLAQLQQDRPVEAEAVLREALAIRERSEPDSWTTFNTRSTLGGALLKQQKYADAGPLLTSGYAGMKERVAKIPPFVVKRRLTEALDRLITLAEATAKADEAKGWRDEKAGLTAPPTEPAKP